MIHKLNIRISPRTPLVKPAVGVRLMAMSVKRLEIELKIATKHLFFNSSENYTWRKLEIEDLKEKLAVARRQLRQFEAEMSEE